VGFGGDGIAGDICVEVTADQKSPDTKGEELRSDLVIPEGECLAEGSDKRAHMGQEDANYRISFRQNRTRR